MNFTNNTEWQQTNSLPTFEFDLIRIERHILLVIGLRLLANLLIAHTYDDLMFWEWHCIHISSAHSLRTKKKSFPIFIEWTTKYNKIIIIMMPFSRLTFYIFNSAARVERLPKLTCTSPNRWAELLVPKPPPTIKAVRNLPCPVDWWVTRYSAKVRWFLGELRPSRPKPAQTECDFPFRHAACIIIIIIIFNNFVTNI